MNWYAFYGRVLKMTTDNETLYGNPRVVKLASWSHASSDF